MNKNPKKRIKFYYAGGTIGMRPDANGLLGPPHGDDDFKETCLPIVRSWQASNDIEVDYEFITAKDSMNMTPDDWQSIIYRAYDAQENGYDAVCIAHGTDTMVYTASALAFGFHDRVSNLSTLKIPIVLTGAQNPIFMFGGDAPFNLQNLFRTAKAAIDIAIRSLFAAADEDAGTGGPDLVRKIFPSVASIDKNGINFLTDDDIAKRATSLLSGPEQGGTK